MLQAASVPKTEKIYEVKEDWKTASWTQKEIRSKKTTNNFKDTKSKLQQWYKTTKKINFPKEQNDKQKDTRCKSTDWEQKVNLLAENREFEDAKLQRESRDTKMLN